MADVVLTQRGFHVTIVPSRALCGLNPGEFAVVLERLAPHVEAMRAERLCRPGRKRAPGAGAKPRPFAFRLLVALSHLRLGTSLRETASMFGIDEKSVRNWRDEVEAVLVRHGVVVPGRAEPVRDLGELRGWLQEMAALPESYAILDATETPRSRPGSWEAQRPAWSGKSRDHVVAGTAVATPDGRVVWFEANPSGEGRTHDLAMLRAQAGLLGALACGIALVGDLAYQGLERDVPGDVWVPRRRRPGRPLPRDDRLYNRALAQARIKVEHGLAAMKRWGAMRRWRRAPQHYDRTAKAVTVLESLRA